MRPFRDLPIRKKLKRVILLTSSVTVALACAAFVAFQLASFWTKATSELTSLADIVAANSTAALAFQDPAAARDNLATLSARPGIVSACLYDARGAVFAEYRRGGAVKWAAPRRARAEAIRFEGGHLTLTRSVELSGDRLGTIYLRDDLRREYALLVGQVGIALAVMLISLLVATLLSSFLAGRISRPILELAQVAQSVRLGRTDPVRARKRGHDEIGVLIDAFNEMLDRIEDQNAALRSAHDDLKLEVAERRRAEQELKALNETLEERVAERSAALEQRARELTEANRALTIENAERRRAEAELAGRSEELARSNSDLEQFAYVASHDLKEPLRTVKSYTQLLAKRYRGKLDADADEFIGFACEGVARMGQLIEDLLAYSLVGRGKSTREPADCSTALKRALANLEGAIRESGAKVTYDELPALIAEPTLLVQLFQNLISNAIKFRSEKPPDVHVHAEQHDDEWVFAVRDNGLGIGPEYAQRIFVLFHRLHGRSAYPGTGIGLAICKRIVERHGGRIWVESEPGQGATFYFTLPAAVQARNLAAA